MLASRGPGVRVNAWDVRQSPPHWKSESVRLWRLLEGPVSASLPNSLGLTPARCSESAALSSRTQSRCEAGQTVVADGSIQNGSSRLLISQVFLPRSVPNRHLQDALRTKCFFSASVPNIALSHRRHDGPSR